MLTVLLIQKVFFKMNHAALKNRLKSIRQEIIALRTAPYEDLREKIINLGKINALLIEQNELLLQRQNIFRKHLELNHYIDLDSISSETDLNNEKNLNISPKSTNFSPTNYYSTKTAI